MKRRNFLSGIGLTALVSAIPERLFSRTAVIEPQSEVKIKFSDIFTKRATNRNLCRFKNSEYSKALYERIRNEGILVYHENTPVYCTDWSIALAVKKEYTEAEIDWFFESLFDACCKREKLSHNDWDGIMRFIIDKKQNVIRPDIFWFNTWSFRSTNPDHISRAFYKKEDRHKIKMDYKNPEEKTLIKFNS